jgi:hypothetical protein
MLAFAVHTASGVFFYETSELPADDIIDADWLADFIEKKGRNLCGGTAIISRSTASRLTRVKLCDLYGLS